MRFEVNILTSKYTHKIFTTESYRKIKLENMASINWNWNPLIATANHYNDEPNVVNLKKCTLSSFP